MWDCDSQLQVMLMYNVSYLATTNEMGVVDECRVGASQSQGAWSTVCTSSLLSHPTLIYICFNADKPSTGSSFTELAKGTMSFMVLSRQQGTLKNTSL